MQCDARKSLHDEERLPCCTPAKVRDTDDVWVVQCSQRLSLHPKSVDQRCIVGELGTKDLDHKAAIQRPMDDLEDVAHAAAAQQSNGIVGSFGKDSARLGQLIGLRRRVMWRWDHR
jgi:hypothetical protein